MPAFNYWSSKVFTVTENNTQEELLEKFLKSFCIICQKFYSYAFFAFNLGFHNKNDGITLIMAFYTSLFFVPIIDFLTALSY
jgi:hypothetical protein